MIHGAICQDSIGNYNCFTGKQFVEMTSVREILAQNLKENRRRLGITQPILAERAGLSTHYIAMLELARKFPTSDVLDRLALALEINPNELFSVAVSPERAIEQLQNAILNNLNQAIELSLDRAFEERCKGCPFAIGKSEVLKKKSVRN